MLREVLLRFHRQQRGPTEFKLPSGDNINLGISAHAKHLTQWVLELFDDNETRAKEQVMAVVPRALTKGAPWPYLIRALWNMAENRSTFVDKGTSYQSVKKEFRGDTSAEQTLSRAEEKPGSEERQAALKGVLVKRMMENPDFAAAVHRLIIEVKVTDSSISQTVVAGDHSTISGVKQVISDEPSGPGEGRQGPRVRHHHQGISLSEVAEG